MFLGLVSLLTVEVDFEGQLWFKESKYATRRPGSLSLTKKPASATRDSRIIFGFITIKF